MTLALEHLAAEEAAMEAEEVEQLQPDDKQAEPDIITEASDTAGDVAVFAADFVGGVVRLFEPRIDLGEEVTEAREEVGPLVEKHELHRGGTGQAFAYKPEVQAGFWFGRFIKSIVKQFKYYRSLDEKQPEGKQVNHAVRPDQREPQTEQHPYPVSSEVGLWQESDATQEKPDS